MSCVGEHQIFTKEFLMQKVLLSGVVFWGLSLMLLSSAWAGTKTTPENCQSVGSALVKCYDCANRKYLGNVAVLTGYEEDQGESFCVVASEAKSACSSAFGVSSFQIGFYTKFRMGTGSKEEFYDTSCVEAVGY